MRKPLAIAIVCASAIAGAQPAKLTKVANEKPPAVIDIKPHVAKLDVFKDELGNFYVTPTIGPSDAETKDLLFFGNGKAMYQQRIIGYSSDKKGFDWQVWAPRATGMTGGHLRVKEGDFFVQCRSKDGKRALTKLAADEAAALLGRAKFYAPLWPRMAHFLARDDDAIYYFVDNFRPELGGHGYRVYIGSKGAMKLLPMTNMASDSAGEIFATRSGQLKIVANKDGQAYWIKGGKKNELTLVPPQDNLYLIYRELGIYGQLGTICDDQ